MTASSRLVESLLQSIHASIWSYSGRTNIPSYSALWKATICARRRRLHSLTLKKCYKSRCMCSSYWPTRVLSPESASFFLLSQSKDTLSIITKEPAQIGIIAPYRAQCTKLRKTLRGFAPEIKIGSVEEYQGDVRGVLPNDFLYVVNEVWHGLAGASGHHHHDRPK
jgi:hypothetical protein